MPCSTSFQRSRQAPRQIRHVVQAKHPRPGRIRPVNPRDEVLWPWKAGCLTVGYKTKNDLYITYLIFNIYMHSWLYMIIQCIVYTGAQIGFSKGSPSEFFLADSKRSCSESGSKISKKTFPGSPKHTQYTNPKSIKNAPTLKANGLKHGILLNTLKIHIVYHQIVGRDCGNSIVDPEILGLTSILSGSFVVFWLLF